MNTKRIFHKKHGTGSFFIVGIFLMLLVSQAMAMYNFEGLPFKTAAQGEVTGNVLVFGSYGLQDPPVTSEFTVPYEIQWARTYVGVWGGTPRYTGWVQTTVNGQPFEKLTLYGQDDKTPNVYCTGYGVYWIAYDTTSLCRQGQNTISAITSKGEAENKLDGRIYSVITVVITKDQNSGNTQYWILEGNQNIHGEGWSGLNPSSHEETMVSISVPEITHVRSANLTAVYLTSTRGQPDYLTFNGQDLGQVVSGPNYPEGARDIADERSFNAGYSENPVDGRYFDIETFDISSLVKAGTNEVTFFRGRDLNGDGIITETGEKPEGEDYLHPVLVLLTLQKPRPEATEPDLAIRQIEVNNAFEGETATILVNIDNLGTLPLSPAELKVTIDGTPIETRQIAIGKSGVQQVSVPWQTIPGSHIIRADITVGGDPDSSNNAAEKEVKVGSLPDLSVSLKPPSRPGSEASSGKAPLPLPLVILSIGLAAVILTIARHRRPPNRTIVPRILPVIAAALLVSAGCGMIPAPATADSQTSLYLLPVIVKNSGGSDAPAFILTIYIDGEKVATKSCDSGIPAGSEISADIPVHTSPGSHIVKVIADEAGTVKDSDRSNNVVETTYVFP